MESPPKLGLGTICISAAYGGIDLTRACVCSLGMRMEKCQAPVRDRQSASQRREIFRVLLRAPFFLDKWCRVATYFFIQKKKRKEKLNTTLHD